MQSCHSCIIILHTCSTIALNADFGSVISFLLSHLFSQTFLSGESTRGFAIQGVTIRGFDNSRPILEELILLYLYNKPGLTIRGFAIQINIFLDLINRENSEENL